MKVMALFRNTDLFIKAWLCLVSAGIFMKVTALLVMKFMILFSTKFLALFAEY